jgi:hypothetical protein
VELEAGVSVVPPDSKFRLSKTKVFGTAEFEAFPR